MLKDYNAEQNPLKIIKGILFSKVAGLESKALLKDKPH